jgi:predicted SnoaL-like aldol condensation-catalyzing enzyme
MNLRGETIKFKYNYHVIAEGYVADQKVTFFDLFRIEDSKIIEH